ncbi:hypothetical protein NOR53_2803 [gamma proteobacterium NOR5-3]|nr:hypothetical protein NOR53_2803 [gamma proteobacterium NOR5-3]
MKASELIEKIMEDPSFLEERGTLVDPLLMQIVKLEKRHLYGMETTSDRKRRDELENLMRKEFAE